MQLEQPSDCLRVLYDWHKVCVLLCNREHTLYYMKDTNTHTHTAHAKLMYRNEVILQDAVVAVTIMECSMQSAALLGGVNILHSAFPSNADEEYSSQG